MNNKKLQAKGKLSYITPEVMVVAFRLERGYTLSNLEGNSTTNFESDNSWADMSDGGTFGMSAFETQEW